MGREDDRTGTAAGAECAVNQGFTSAQDGVSGGPSLCRDAAHRKLTIKGCAAEAAMVSYSPPSLPFPFPLRARRPLCRRATQLYTPGYISLRAANLN
jgi:hypothetical protein